MDALKNQPGKTGPGDGGDTDTVKQAAEEQMRRDVLASILDPAARERLARVALVSLERSRQIEGILLRNMQAGRIHGRISDSQLVELLEQADAAHSNSPAKSSSTTIVYHRRGDESDWEI